MSQYLFFIDESWDHSLQNINEDFPYFLLCGILISEENYKIFSEKMNLLKIKYFWTDNVIFHSRDIRKCEWYFVKLFDLEIKKSFYQDLNWLIQETDFTIISNTVKKEDYLKLYGKTAINPYNISLSYILERMIFKVDEILSSSVSIYIEKRWKKEDQLLLSHYNTVLDIWTYYVKPLRFKNKIEDFIFRAKIDNDIWIQLADLCAYPLISAIRNNDFTNPAYLIIDSKLYRNPKTWHKSWLKIIP